MKKDIDKDHDLTDPEVYKKKIRDEDQKSKAPCGKCPGQHDCESPVKCQKYQEWRRRYLKRRYGP